VFNAPFKADLIVITELGSFLMGLPQGERISTIGLAVWRQTHTNWLTATIYTVRPTQWMYWTICRRCRCWWCSKRRYHLMGWRDRTMDKHPLSAALRLEYWLIINYTVW